MAARTNGGFVRATFLFTASRNHAQRSSVFHESITRRANVDLVIDFRSHCLTLKGEGTLNPVTNVWMLARMTRRIVVLRDHRNRNFTMPQGVPGKTHAMALEVTRRRGLRSGEISRKLRVVFREGTLACDDLMIVKLSTRHPLSCPRCAVIPLRRL